MIKVLFIFGTRPEAIKFAPLIKQMQAQPDKFTTAICVTGQHKEMLYQVLDFFEISPDYDLSVMELDQTLYTISSKIIRLVEPILAKESPDLVFVQGDTTTVLMGALGAFYSQIPVAHLEAGLRTGNMYSPFPEEMNRVLVSKMTKFHFTPTKSAFNNLLKENIDSKYIYHVGNTVIDALNLAVDLIEKNEDKYKKVFSGLNFSKKTILVTSHRRESAGEGFVSVCNAIKALALSNDIEVVFPIHYSPAIRKAAKEAGLYEIANIHMLEPLDYPSMVYLMKKSYIVLTDSGGIQEEAPSLGKPVLVMRETTERPEGVEAGVAKLVGTDTTKIINETQKLLDDHEEYIKMAEAINPYGDGTTSQQILKVLSEKQQG